MALCFSPAEVGVFRSLDFTPETSPPWQETPLWRSWLRPRDPRVSRKDAKTQREKTRIFIKIHYQERASSVVSVPLWFKTAAWLFHQRPISGPSAVPGCGPGILESHAKTPRRKGRKPGSLSRSTTRSGLPPWSLCLCGSKRLLGCFISGPSAAISGPGCCPGMLESHAKTLRRKGR